jgi:hypothetical protein
MSDVIRRAVLANPRLSHCDVADDVALLRRAIVRASREFGAGPMWSHVGSMTGHGSGVATAICVALGLDPDQHAGREPGEEG